GWTDDCAAHRTRAADRCGRAGSELHGGLAGVETERRSHQRDGRPPSFRTKIGSHTTECQSWRRGTEPELSRAEKVVFTCRSQVNGPPFEERLQVGGRERRIRLESERCRARDVWRRCGRPAETRVATGGRPEYRRG